MKSLFWGMCEVMINVVVAMLWGGVVFLIAGAVYYSMN
jgi:hypothetical protein